MTDSGASTDNGAHAGYGAPPAHGRFCKGQSGNPRGRPRKPPFELPYDTVFNASITVMQNGQPKQVTVEEALILKIKKDALTGTARATTDLRKLLAIGPKVRQARQAGVPDKFHIRTTEVNSIGEAISALRIVKKLDPYGPNCRYMLEPWIVQLALSRLGDRQLSVEDQQQVYANTRTPHKVDWPDWWVIKRG